MKSHPSPDNEQTRPRKGAFQARDYSFLLLDDVAIRSAFPELRSEPHCFSFDCLPWVVFLSSRKVILSTYYVQRTAPRKNALLTFKQLTVWWRRKAKKKMVASARPIQCEECCEGTH